MNIGFYMKDFLAYRLVQWPRILLYRYLLSDFTGDMHGDAYAGVSQPLIIRGQGRVEIAENVKFGYKKSPYFYSGSCYVEARHSGARISVGRDVHFNNSCALISADDGIEIGDHCVFGVGCSIMDNDFHAVPGQAAAKGKAVKIGRHVFVGSHVSILKGVEIADHCVIANGAVVTRSFKTPCVIAGNPAKKVRDLDLG